MTNREIEEVRRIAYDVRLISSEITPTGAYGVVKHLIEMQLNRHRPQGLERKVDYVLARMRRRTRLTLGAMISAYWNDHNRSRAILCALTRQVNWVYRPTDAQKHARDWRIFWS